jgi:hypothetical protein
LRRDRPDLANRVVAGEISANAAAIQAGFRKKLAPFEQAQRLWFKMTKEEREQFLEWAQASLRPSSLLVEEGQRARACRVPQGN